LNKILTDNRKLIAILISILFILKLYTYLFFPIYLFGLESILIICLIGFFSYFIVDRYFNTEDIIVSYKKSILYSSVIFLVLAFADFLFKYFLVNFLDPSLKRLSLSAFNNAPQLTDLALDGMYSFPNMFLSNMGSSFFINFIISSIIALIVNIKNKRKGTKNTNTNLSFVRFVITPTLTVIVFYFILFQFHKKPSQKNEEIALIEIDCKGLKSTLKSIYSTDQALREDGVISDADEKIDMKNLQIVVSLIEKCGFPTLKDVDTIGMDAIILTLQHANGNQFSKKYLPFLKAAAMTGDIKQSTIALMEDRILMYDGKAQIYGTQIMDGKLYQLDAPEYVNQRRQSVGLGRIEIYLKKFNIEFNVEQKLKM
jgi:hypothetical protein